MRLSLFLAAGALLPQAWSWGAIGHEIVATIAQIHLHPSTRKKLCGILPPEAKCHLAPVAAWADQVRMKYRGTAGMHYINGKDDHPSDTCYFGQHGWMNEDINVLTAVANMTQLIMDVLIPRDIPLRFLIHFIGDMHQPLHLTGRDKGGNGALFRWEGHMRNLHSVWDGGLITKKIRELGNYTSPLPSRQIESSLLGTIFDPYVRFIVWEGIRQWYLPSLPTWLSCPSTGYALPLKETENLQNALLNLHPLKLNQTAWARGMEKGEMVFPVCPFHWAQPLHSINCDLAWPKEYTGNHSDPLIELDSDDYYGKIVREKTLERLLAMAGLRLAKVLNEVYGDESEILYLSYL
ncbi:hypothetical protein TREMEDRAFT_28516 [Tremella mesenterica DSM 1558]|uniref:uncharacterized protein n=1 Tax=Tremella mesenterica (strain ATCC 24925 / CBS 8224 / DSM 1558 / NBRC 9311 / NRRL Y-6157 / RJB 2259-6 / UBC 559-6) TaxID=578456 RepID=UPI0003F49569|nr:uncharacterized protein TREMEDRAFT_28516 [Tremella mesenterica DSM 1558]EIW70722.1 hypothetical protein TREMEDRAFT_28516 [Tremella mesenterica DSM 1558]